MAEQSKQAQQSNWVLVSLGLLFLFVIMWAVVSNLDFSSSGRPIKFGVTFSKEYASRELGLDWTEVYLAILNDLQVKDIRLAVAWDKIEQADNFYNFADYEWMVEQAEKRGVNIIMAIGRRTPRWPECHEPSWVKRLSQPEQDKELLEYIKKLVEHFKGYKNIIAWQVENEPFLDFFGECPPSDMELLKEEVALVKSLDQRPIIITDTGELSDWHKAASLADIFGTTMYKAVWNKYIGVWRYPWPPAYYYFKAKKIKAKYDLQKVIVAELQAEPWSKGQPITQMSLWDQFSLFDSNDFRNNLDYVKRAGFEEAYLWGVEWWYWLKQVKNEPIFWNQAKLIWQTD